MRWPGDAVARRGVLGKLRKTRAAVPKITVETIVPVPMEPKPNVAVGGHFKHPVEVTEGANAGLPAAIGTQHRIMSN